MRVGSALALIIASLVASLTAFITPASAGDYHNGGGYYGPRYSGYNGNGYYRPRHHNGGYSSSCCYRKVSYTSASATTATITVALTTVTAGGVRTIAPTTTIIG